MPKQPLPYLRPVLRLALGPTRHASNLWGWWPLIAAIASPILALLGLSPLPDAIHVARPWWFAVAALVIGVLFLRAAYVLYARSIGHFPAALIDSGYMEQGASKDADGSLSIFTTVLVVNREPARGMSLVLSLHVVDREGNRLTRIGGWPALHGKPLDLKPEASELVKLGPFTIKPERLEGLATRTDPAIPVPLLEVGSVQLTVTDHISGQSVAFTVPGRYEASASA